MKLCNKGFRRGGIFILPLGIRFCELEERDKYVVVQLEEIYVKQKIDFKKKNQDYFEHSYFSIFFNFVNFLGLLKKFAWKTIIDRAVSLCRAKRSYSSICAGTLRTGMSLVLG